MKLTDDIMNYLTNEEIRDLGIAVEANMNFIDLMWELYVKEQTKGAKNDN